MSRGGAEPPLVHPARARYLGAAVVLTVCLVLCGAFARALVQQSMARRPPAVPFDPGVMVAEGAGGAIRIGAAFEPAVVLYVSDRCPFCAAELRAWDQALAKGAGQRGPIVVRGPDSDPATLGIVPPSLRPSEVFDRDGSVARALKVAAVPYVAVLDAGGSVVDVKLGVSNHARIEALIALLNPFLEARHEP